ncbi:unnamed protein product [Pedinophyceae sp. YPF-701]|nr:unnamed protein product [Pedinophyceae sp. YPF-701]
MVRDAAAAVREALALKKAGNDKFAHGRADDALALYTQALGSGAACAPVTAPRFAAVLHSNRAACHQKLGRNAEALADCCRALALAPGYSKALSRMASLLGVVGRHEDAEKYLRKMLECADVKASAERRRDVEERIAAEQGHVRAVGHGEEVPDHFQILGLKTTCSSDEVRKAYKQLARSIHPDKALATCGGRLVSAGALAGVLDLGVWVDGAPHEEDAKDRAGWLFKCVQEAVSTLTDPHKRTAYEAERETAQRRKKYWSASARSGGVRHGGFGHVPRHSNPFSHNFYAGWGAYDEYDDGYGDPWGDADGHEYYTGYAEDYSNMRREQQQRNGGGGGYARAGSFGGAHRAHAGGRHYGHGGYAYRGAGAGGAGRR